MRGQAKRISRSSKCRKRSNYRDSAVTGSSSSFRSLIHCAVIRVLKRWSRTSPPKTDDVVEAKSVAGEIAKVDRALADRRLVAPFRASLTQSCHFVDVVSSVPTG